MKIELTQEERNRIQLIPTKNIQAFIAYCTGLASQDGGNFTAAAAHYEKAGKLDNDFIQAKTRAKTSHIIDHASGTIRQFAAKAGVVTSSSKDLVADRLLKLNSNISTNFRPGIDNRQPIEESISSGVDIGIMDLPDPPVPPGN